LERRTTYANVQINGGTNVYYATPGQTLTLTGNYSEVHFQDFVPGYVTYCPGCITQNYIGIANDNYTGNNFDGCYDVSGTYSNFGALSTNFTAPTRPGVYYITQKSSWNNFCYQFGHILQDQNAYESIAVVIVNPADGITGNTTATDASPAGDYPIVVGGGHFNNNYRIVFHDGILTVVEPPVSLRTTNATNVASNARTIQTTPTASQPGITEESKQVITASGIKSDLLYPNPAISLLRLQLKDDVLAANDIKIYDGVGKLNTASIRKINGNLYEINVSGLSNGIYVIEAKTAAGIRTFKFMKM
jgi:hypothetical protein